MSRYGYDYPLTPSRQNGWRSAFTSILTVGTIVAISAISGGVVALNLLGPNSTADGPAIVTTRALPASIARTATPAPPQPARTATITTAAIAQPKPSAATSAPAPVQTTAQPAAAPAQAAPAAAASVASVEQPTVPQAHAQVPERELTFTHGYARRRAVQAAAEAVSGAKVEVARAESQNQVGRAAIKAKPKLAHQAPPPQEQRRVADAREEGGPFSRFDQPEKFDFARHQALAFGEPREPHANRAPPAPAPRQGGLFGNSPSGFFGGLF